MSYSYNFSMRDLLDAGVHFGHRKNFWNPKMATYIYGSRNGVHIIDLQQTLPMLKSALEALKDVASKNGRILFVGTKKQASEIISDNAKRCGQYYVNHRWLGGMLTNWPTISASIKTLSRIEELLADPQSTLTKKEKLELDRKREKLDKVLGGIRNMGGKPDLLFVIDINQEHIAIAEARKLGIPVIAVADTNTNPEEIDFVIPGNDDARKAIELYTKLASDAILSGIQEGLSHSGVDVGNVDLMAANDFAIDLSSLGQNEKQDEPKTQVVKKRSTAKKADAPAAQAVAQTEAAATEASV